MGRVVANHRPALWKHRIFREQPPLEDDMFCICLVKDPVFWIQSLARDPQGGSFYDIDPMELQGLSKEEKRCKLEAGQLFRPVLFDGVRYEDAVEIWEATVR